MGWSCGYDVRWERDIGYGVPALCDQPTCLTTIDRGLSYVCGSDPYGGEHGCGLYFCGDHLHFTDDGDTRRTAHGDGPPPRLCARCLEGDQPYGPTADVIEWTHHKLTDESWADWREENPAEVERMLALVPPGVVGS